MGNINIRETGLAGVKVITLPIYKDHRGSFMETYTREIAKRAGLPLPHEFVQENQSQSCYRVLRGLHFQKEPNAQGKLVRIVSGCVLDVMIDLRKSSQTFGKVHREMLSENDHKILWIPEGFAHGFVSLHNNTIFCYKATTEYCTASESGIIWNDPTLNIGWTVNNPIVSEKDQRLPRFDPDAIYFE